MKIKYYIGKIGFKTKKECENYTRSIIEKISYNKIEKDNEHFIFFNDLIKNHPDFESKQGIGIDYFYIIPSPLTKQGYQTMIKHPDGNETSFRWRSCCEFREKNTNEYLTKAMRTAVKEIVIQYKREQCELICNICKNKNEPYEKYEVDHDNPSFKKLKDDFLCITTIPIPSSFAKIEKINLTIFKDQDTNFENDWIKYHNENCRFQILCSGCNQRKR
jgi:hypothetical protein